METHNESTKQSKSKNSTFPDEQMSYLLTTWGMFYSVCLKAAHRGHVCTCLLQQESLEFFCMFCVNLMCVKVCLCWQGVNKQQNPPGQGSFGGHVA